MPGSLSIPTPVMAQASTPNFESESPHSPPQQEDPPTVVAEDVPAHVSPSIPVEDVQSESESIDWISTILSLLQLVAEFIILAVCGVVRLILFVCAPWLKKREEKEVVVEAFTMRKDIPSILVPSAATTTTTTTTLSSSSSLNTVVVVDDSPPLRIHLPDHAHHAILATSPAAERTPLVAERIRRKITDSVVNARRRLALVRRPYVHLETDLVVEEGSVAPLPIDQHAKERAQRTRKDANTCIRECLRRLPVGDLESTLRVHACTWNVDQCDPPPPQDASYVRWLVGAELSAKIFGYFTHAAHGGVSTELEGRRAEIEDELPDMIIVSLQEVDMRGIALVRESTKSSARWTDGIVSALQHTCSPFSVNFKKLHLVQLVGLVLLVFVQSKHVPYISHVQLSMTRTGALGMLGNKGSVAMRATIYGKRFLFIAAHFEAHKQNERNRAANYRSALNDLCFDMNENVNDESDILNTFECAIAQTGVVVEDPELNIAGTRPLERVLSAIGDRMSVSTANRVLDLHDYVFFVGDLNARLHAIRRDAIDNHIAKKEYDLLLCHDELRQGMIVGEVFDGFQEPIITFPPTYKFDRCSDAYDTSSDRRDPAWTDRVLFRVLRTVHEDSVVAEEPHSLPLSMIQRSRTTEALRRGSGSGSHTMARSVGAPHSSTILGTHETLDEDGEWITLHSIEHVAHNDDDDDDYSVENSDDVSISDDENPFQSQATRSLSRRCLSTTEDFRGSDAETFRAVRRPPTVTQTASIVANQVRVLEYTSVPDLRISDHRPVCARFDVAVLSIAPRVVYQILSEVRRVVGDEEGGLSRRSVSRRILK